MSVVIVAGCEHERLNHFKILLDKKAGGDA